MVRFCSKFDVWVGVEALHDCASEKVGFEDLQVIEIQGREVVSKTTLPHPC